MRFVAVCLRGPEHDGVRDELLGTGPPKLEGGRAWQTIAKTSTWHGRVGDVVRENWSLAAMQGGDDNDNGNDDDDDGDEEGTGMAWVRQSRHMVRANAAITDIEYWTEEACLNAFSELIECLENWARGCKCHP